MNFLPRPLNSVSSESVSSFVSLISSFVGHVSTYINSLIFTFARSKLLFPHKILSTTFSFDGFTGGLKNLVNTGGDVVHCDVFFLPSGKDQSTVEEDEEGTVPGGQLRGEVDRREFGRLGLGREWLRVGLLVSPEAGLRNVAVPPVQFLWRRCGVEEVIDGIGRDGVEAVLLEGVVEDRLEVGHLAERVVLNPPYCLPFEELYLVRLGGQMLTEAVDKVGDTLQFHIGVVTDLVQDEVDLIPVDSGPFPYNPVVLSCPSCSPTHFQAFE